MPPSPSFYSNQRLFFLLQFFPKAAFAGEIWDLVGAEKSVEQSAQSHSFP